MTTVLFIHGLESGPRGKKAEALEQAGFTVVAGQMPCGRRAAVRDPVVVGAYGVMVAGVLVAAIRQGVMGFIFAAMFVAVTQGFVRSRLIRRMVRRSLAVQAELLKTKQIDVVMGSSFGGAVALELLSRGLWKGPTVLLCPAHRLVAERAWLAPKALPEDASRVVVVHGRVDETVPSEHSRSLVRSSRARLIEVDDDHRLTATTTPENFRAWVGLAQQ